VWNVGVPEMSERLAQYGFSAIVVNRKGYADGGASLISEFDRFGLPVVADELDLIAWKLPNQGLASLPIPLHSIDFGDGFHSEELSSTEKWRWSKVTDPTVIVKRSWYAQFAKEASVEAVDLGIQGLVPCNIWLTNNGQAETLILSSDQREARFSVPVQETAILKIRSDCIPKSPGNGDLRKLGFRIYQKN
jgi:hypothetical protein